MPDGAPTRPEMMIYANMNDAMGWAPVTHMIRLAARLFEAGTIDSRAFAPDRWKNWRPMLLPARRGGEGVAIFVARSPQEIPTLMAAPGFLRPHRARVLWIIDSFRVHHLPHRRRLAHFDLVCFSQSYDRSAYEDICGGRALHLGWGTDALDLGGFSGERRYDLLRVGRQPADWDDDEATARAAAVHGLSFHGRPPRFDDPSRQQALLVQDWYRQTKYVLAHTNLADETQYTHKTKEYITARWTDALAAGATVAGRPPESDLSLLSWPEALLPFPDTDLTTNIARVADAARHWTPDIARRNHLGALRHLDWRWRFRALADALALDFPVLDAEIARLQARIADLSAGEKDITNA